jgi:RNA polymerase sigma-B factor
MSEALAGTGRDAERLVAEYVRDPRPDLKDVIVLQYAGLVEKVARRFSGIEPVEDLVQVGFIGLLNALSKFDPTAGVRFNTYATHLVAGEIKHYLRDKTQTIRQPAWLQELRHRVVRQASVLQADLGRTPTPQEVAAACGVSEQSIHEVYATQELLRVSSLDAPVADDDDSESDLDRLEENLVEGQVGIEDRLVLETAMCQLREIERDVLVHFESLNQTEIASRLGISCNYVSHILRNSASKLRKILDNEELADRALLREVGQDTTIIDSVTGAYTEKYFRGRLTEEVHRARAGQAPVSLVTIEFRGLKALRSFYGEASVQDLLADAAEQLRQSVRSLDIVCRYGPSGFAVLLPATGASAVAVRQRLERKFTQWTVGRGCPNSPVSVRLGLATAPTEADTVEGVLEAARPSEFSQAPAA